MRKMYIFEFLSKKTHSIIHYYYYCCLYSAVINVITRNPRPRLMLPGLPRLLTQSCPRKKQKKNRDNVLFMKTFRVFMNHKQSHELPLCPPFCPAFVAVVVAGLKATSKRRVGGVALALCFRMTRLCQVEGQVIE